MQFRRLLRVRLPRPAAVRRELHEELEAHIALCVDELTQRGTPPEDALARARARFGNYDHSLRALEASALRREKQMRRLDLWDALRQNTSFALRQIRRAPGFSTIVALTLGLGIGANAAMFAIVDRLLLSPPAHTVDADRLARIQVIQIPESGPAYPVAVTNYALYRDLIGASSLEGVAAFGFPQRVSLGRGRAASAVRVNAVSATFFPTLGARPALGRFFLPDEDAIGAATPVAIISYEYWHSHFGGDPSVLGRVLPIKDDNYRIIGVTPRGFTGIDLRPVDAWVPMTFYSARQMGNDFVTDRGSLWMMIVARLQPGVSWERASAELTAIFRQRAVEATGRMPKNRIELSSVIAARGPEKHLESTVAVWLLGVAVVVLLIACANVATLLLTRVLRRRDEIAVRFALGVSRGRLAGQLAIESLALAVLGAAAAVVTAFATKGVVTSVLMRDVANVGTLTPRTGFVIATGVVLATLVTTLPLLHHVFDVHIGTMLKSHAPTHSGARDGLRSSLQFLQAVLSVALLIGAGLFVQSLRAAEQTRIGLDADRVLLAEVDLGPPTGEIRPVANDAIGNDPASRFWREALARVSATRNVESAALAITTPLRFAIAGTFRVPGREKQLTFTSGPYRNGVTAGYFSTIGARLLRGRDFAVTDARTSPRVVILNQTLARAAYPGVDPIGQCVRVYRADSIPCATIVGVVEDVRRSGLEEETTYQYYMPLDQWIGPHSTVMMVRARAGTTKQVVAAVRSVLQSIASSAPFPMVQPMSDLVEPHLRAWRLGARAFTMFGGLAFLVAIVGLYGLISYGVQQRRFEFGIRSALGAGPGVIVRLVLWRGLALMVAGVVGGVGLAMFAGRWLGPLLFHVSPRDPSIYAVVIVVAMATALAALAVPARRASRVDPALALRSE